MNSRNLVWHEGLAILVGSFFFTGFFPIAPATVASAAATVLFAFILPLSPLAMGLLLLLLFSTGIWACGRLERLYGQDPSAAVLDEVCGMALTLAAAPITPATLLLGFLLFRVFDVLKLPPGRALEKLHGGWGIMMDDVLAGVYAAIVLQICVMLWPGMQLQKEHGMVLAALGLLLFFMRKPLMRRYGKPRTRFRARQRGNAP